MLLLVGFFLHAGKNPRRACLDWRLVEVALRVVVSVVVARAPVVQQRAHTTGDRDVLQQRLPLPVRLWPGACARGKDGFDR